MSVVALQKTECFSITIDWMLWHHTRLNIEYYNRLNADMENVNMFTQASFLKIKFYPKERKLRQMLITTKQQKLCKI